MDIRSSHHLATPLSRELRGNDAGERDPIGNVLRLTYDPFSRLKSAFVDAQATLFLYNGEDQRVTKNDPHRSTSYIHEKFNQVRDEHDDS